MKTFTDQTVYQCEYCNKRLLSKNGAKLHEEDYCKDSPIKLEKRIQEIKQCDHEWDWQYRLQAGEDAVYEPDYKYCYKCWVEEYQLEKLEEKGKLVGRKFPNCP